MDETLLRPLLGSRTRLIVGDVRHTVHSFFDDPQMPPVGFIAIDLDLYSSTTHALRILSAPGRRVLQHVPVYLDDIEVPRCHRFGGELLAVEEFNQENDGIKIDCWRGIRLRRPFPDEPYLGRMFMAHDLEAISKESVERDSVRIPLVVPAMNSVNHRSR
jgi:hypothetical protein